MADPREQTLEQLEAFIDRLVYTGDPVPLDELGQLIALENSVQLRQQADQIRRQVAEIRRTQYDESDPN